MTRYCIIGGGAVGIATGKSFRQHGIDFDLYEGEDDFGGTWYFGSGASLVYPSAHLISSKNNTQFSDCPMPADFPAYPNHEQFLVYLRSVARKFELYKNAHLGAKVESVERAGSMWRVRVAGDHEVRTYDGVVVANGRMRRPIFPEYRGKFGGETLHSGAYSTPEVFRGKRVLVVGGGNSGCDIAVAAIPMAKKVFHSTRRAYHYMPKFIAGRPTQEWLMELPPRFKASDELRKYVNDTFKLAGYDPSDYGLRTPDYEFDQAHPVINSLILYHIGHGDVYPKVDVAELGSDRVTFVDGSQEIVDLVLYCTGFRPEFPFFERGIMQWKAERPDLFLYMLHPEFDNLWFGGFLNAASGLGNVANCMGEFMASYIRAYERRSDAFRTMMAFKRGPEPDLGQGRFVKTERHAYEVDMWKFIRTVNALRTKLDQG